MQDDDCVTVKNVHKPALTGRELEYFVVYLVYPYVRPVSQFRSLKMFETVCNLRPLTGALQVAYVIERRLAFASRREEPYLPMHAPASTLLYTKI